MECRKFLLLIILFVTLSSSLSEKSSVLNLNEDNWQQMLQNEWMVEFFAPWCPACKSLAPTWKTFSEWSRDLGIKVGQVDVTTSPGLSGRFMVTALPTIFHVINGEFRQYKGTRDKGAFMSFIEEKKWKVIDPIPSWKSPNSLQMSIVSKFFTLSQVLRGVHNQLMIEYGLPTWGSYLIFAVATIFLGAILGLILVCIIDLIYPPKPIMKPTEYTEKQSAKDDIPTVDHDLPDDDIKDDLLDDIGNITDPGKNSESDLSESSETPSPPLVGEMGSPNVRKRKARRAD